jgi:hypothetical protein
VSTLNLFETALIQIPDGDPVLTSPENVLDHVPPSRFIIIALFCRMISFRKSPTFCDHGLGVRLRAYHANIFESSSENRSIFVQFIAIKKYI